MIQLWTGVSGGVAAAVVKAGGISSPALPGFSLQSDWLRFQFTKKSNTVTYTVSNWVQGWEVLNGVSSSLLVWLRLRLLVLSNSRFFHVDVSLTKGKYSWKNMLFGVTLITTIFCGHTSSLPNPSHFILHHPNICLTMFSVVDTLLCYKPNKNTHRLHQVERFVKSSGNMLWVFCFLFFPLFEVLHWMFCRKLFFFFFLLCFQ